MPRGKLPIGFGKTLRALYAQGYTSKDAMRKAWEIHRGSGPGMSGKQQPQKYLTNKKPKRKFRSRAYIRTQAQADAWAKELDKFNNGQPSYIRDKRQAGIVAEELDRWISRNPISHKKALSYARELVKHEKAGVKENPIAVYNPHKRSLLERVREQYPDVEKVRSKNGELHVYKNGKWLFYGYIDELYKQGIKDNPTGKILPMKNVEIRYQRADGQYVRQWFKHFFESSVTVYGLEDGSVLIKSKSGKKLWGTV